MSRFSAHGSFRVHSEGPLVIVHAEGPFNLEFTESFAPVAAEFIERMRGAPWGVLVVARGDFLLTPEAEAAMHQAEVDYEDGGRRVTAFVIADGEWNAIPRGQWARVYRDNARQPRFFASENQARDWLLGELGDLDGSESA